MINFNELIKIGNFSKPHGIKGEIFFNCTNNCFDKSKDLFFVFELEGIFVPFRVESYRFIFNSTALVKLKNINTIEQAHLLSYQEVFSPLKQLTENIELNFSKTFHPWDYFIGFRIIDEKMGEIGYITNIDKFTINTLFIIEKGGKEILIPTADEMITTIDDKQRIIYMQLPAGLF